MPGFRVLGAKLRDCVFGQSGEMVTVVSPISRSDLIGGVAQQSPGCHGGDLLVMQGKVTPNEDWLFGSFNRLKSTSIRTSAR